MIALSASGEVVYLSESVTSLLGHLPVSGEVVYLSESVTSLLGHLPVSGEVVYLSESVTSLLGHLPRVRITREQEMFQKLFLEKCVTQFFEY